MYLICSYIITSEITIYHVTKVMISSFQSTHTHHCLLVACLHLRHNGTRWSWDMGILDACIHDCARRMQMTTHQRMPIPYGTQVREVHTCSAMHTHLRQKKNDSHARDSTLSHTLVHCAVYRVPSSFDRYIIDNWAPRNWKKEFRHAPMNNACQFECEYRKYILSHYSADSSSAFYLCVEEQESLRSKH